MSDRVKDAFLAAVALGQSIAAKNSHYRLTVPRAMDGPVVARVPLPKAPEFGRYATVFPHRPKSDKVMRPKEARARIRAARARGEVPRFSDK